MKARDVRVFFSDRTVIAYSVLSIIGSVAEPGIRDNERERSISISSP
jgi:hypothetical protein